MTSQELATIMDQRVPVKFAIMNNGFLGMVRQWQELFYDNNYVSVDTREALCQPDFVKLAEAYGHVGMRIEKPGDVEGALRDAFAMKDRLVFMNFITDRSENVWPMVKTGKGLSEMLLSSEDL
jgi:acetolactate synthase-1/2/3 large subunit